MCIYSSTPVGTLVYTTGLVAFVVVGNALAPLYWYALYFFGNSTLLVVTTGLAVLDCWGGVAGKGVV